METKCFLCGNPADIHRSDPFTEVACRRCGHYAITRFAIAAGIPEEGRYAIMAATRYASDFGDRILKLSSDEIPRLTATAHRNDPFEAIDRIIFYLYRKVPAAHATLPLDLSLDYPIARAADSDEFAFYLAKAGELNWIEGSYTGYRLTLDGWKHAATLRSISPDPLQGFVAMWMDVQMDPAWIDGIKPAISDSGFSPLRIDSKQHNDMIDDQIMAEIRKSRFLVADVTGQRNGVYFEAGFGLGLGLTVIWSCREDDLKNVHFDTRQFNHVVWIDPADLRTKLGNRIQATIL